MKYSNSTVTSSVKYLQNLQYLARSDERTLNDLFDLYVINNVYQWACWYEVPEEDKYKVQKVMNNILNKNNNLTITDNTPLKYYTNTNTPQTMWTWNRIYDNLKVNEVNVL